MNENLRHASMNIFLSFLWHITQAEDDISAQPYRFCLFDMVEKDLILDMLEPYQKMYGKALEHHKETYLDSIIQKLNTYKNVHVHDVIQDLHHPWEPINLQKQSKQLCCEIASDCKNRPSNSSILGRQSLKNSLSKAISYFWKPSPPPSFEQRTQNYYASFATQAEWVNYCMRKRKDAPEANFLRTMDYAHLLTSYVDNTGEEDIHASSITLKAPN